MISPDCNEGLNPDFLTPDVIGRIQLKSGILPDSTPIVDVYCGRKPGPETYAYLDTLSVEGRRIIDEWDGYLSVALTTEQRSALFAALQLVEKRLARLSEQRNAWRLYENNQREVAGPTEINVGDLRGLQHEIKQNPGEWFLEGDTVRMVGEMFAPRTQA